MGIFSKLFGSEGSSNRKKLDSRYFLNYKDLDQGAEVVLDALQQTVPLSEAEDIFIKLVELWNRNNNEMSNKDICKKVIDENFIGIFNNEMKEQIHDYLMVRTLAMGLNGVLPRKSPKGGYTF